MIDPGRVRPATEADLDEIVHLWAHYIRVNRDNPAFRHLPADAMRRRRAVFERHIRDAESEVFVVERQDGGLDAMLTCFIEDNLPYFLPPRYGRLQTPFVRPEARKRGHMKRLLAAAHRWARARELTEVRLYTSALADTANRIAEDLGFRALEIVRRRAIEWDLPPDRTPFDGD